MAAAAVVAAAVAAAATAAAGKPSQSNTKPLLAEGLFLCLIHVSSRAPQKLKVGQGPPYFGPTIYEGSQGGLQPTFGVVLESLAIGKAMSLEEGSSSSNQLHNAPVIKFGLGWSSPR